MTINSGMVNIAELSKPRDFLDKLEREIQRLKNAQENNGSNLDVFDHGLNAAITGWHMYEWIARERGFKNCDEYRDEMKRQCSDLGLLHDITTQMKHFRVSHAQRLNSESNLSVVASARSGLTPAEEQKIMKGLQENPMGAVYFYPENNFQTVLKIDSRDALLISP